MFLQINRLSIDLKCNKGFKRSNDWSVDRIESFKEEFN